MRKGEEQVMDWYGDAVNEGLDRKKEKLTRAAAIMTMLETEGGRVLVAEMDRLFTAWDLHPEEMFNEKGYVDVGKVSRLAGARECIQTFRALFSGAKKLIEKTAAANSEAVDKSESAV